MIMLTTYNQPGLESVTRLEVVIGRLSTGSKQVRNSKESKLRIYTHVYIRTPY
jgi:hypothetical protein